MEKSRSVRQFLRLGGGRGGDDRGGGNGGEGEGGGGDKGGSGVGVGLVVVSGGSSGRSTQQEIVETLRERGS